jgi:hypothetical protein
VSALVSQYEDNATIHYEGINSIGLTGNYIGAANIRQLLTVWATRFIYIFVTNESQATTQVVTTGSGNSAVAVVVNSTFGFRGESSVLGEFNGTVSAWTTFVHDGTDGTSWLISKETWNFLRFWLQFPVST